MLEKTSHKKQKKNYKQINNLRTNNMDTITLVVIIFGTFALGILLLVTLKSPKIVNLTARLGCPNCNSSKIKKISPSKLECENCGLKLSVT